MSETVSLQGCPRYAAAAATQTKPMTSQVSVLSSSMLTFVQILTVQQQQQAVLWYQVTIVVAAPLLLVAICWNQAEAAAVLMSAAFAQLRRVTSLKPIRQLALTQLLMASLDLLLLLLFVY